MEQAQQEEQTRKRVLIGLGVSAVIVIVLFILLIWYFMGRKPKPVSTPGGQGSGSGSGASGGSGTPPASGASGLIFVDGGSGYSHGLSQAESKARCAQFANGRLATKDELAKARDRGFEACSIGWYDGGAAVVMQKGGPGCGGPGVTVMQTQDPTRKLSTFCYGSSSNPADKVVALA